MIGLDTNVLVRYFAQDDPTQSAQANEVIEGLSEAQPGYVTVIVLVEVYWVLHDAYKTDRGTVVKTLRTLLDSQEIVVERSDTVRRAVRRADDGADFADALIYESGVDAGCERTMTFDKKAAKKAGMTLVT